MQLTGQSITVVQEPPAIFREPGGSVVGKITCSHSIQYYDVILWYHQHGQKTLTLLGLLDTSFRRVGEQAEEKFSFDGDGRSHSSLSISNITPNDGGIYYCASSRHSAAPLRQHGSKTTAAAALATIT